jgi:hypothetical protein
MTGILPDSAVLAGGLWPLFPRAPADPQIAARSDRLIRLRDGVVIDDLDLAEGHSAGLGSHLGQSVSWRS